MINTIWVTVIIKDCEMNVTESKTAWFTQLNKKKQIIQLYKQ